MQFIASYRHALRKPRLVQPALWLLALVVGLFPLLFATSAGAAAPYARAVVFDDGSYVNTSGTVNAESDNVQATLTFLGHMVTTTTGTSNGNFTSALTGSDVMLIPELEVASLSPLSAATISTLAGFVSGGKGIVVFGTSTNRDVSFLNTVFGFSISDGSVLGTSSVLNAVSAVGTQFQSGPVTLPANVQTSGLLTSSLPIGTKSIYTNGAETTIAIIPYGSGSITYLGWDWDNAKPAGSQDGGWITALDNAIHTTVTNTAPTIFNILNQTINEGASTGALAFTIGDVETAAASLTVTASSSNTALVPDANIVFGGTGANHTVTVTPVADGFGSAIITVMVSDGTAMSSDTFLLTVAAVNDAPTATGDSYNADEDTLLSVPLPGVLGNDSDIDSGILVAQLISTTSNGVLTLNGLGAFTYQPAANFCGPDSFEYQASDMQLASATVSVTINVACSNDTPTISDITDQTIDEDTSTGALAFTVGDVETAAASLLVSGSSSNTALVPDANIVFGGTGANRTVTVTPVAGASGTATITVQVSDGTAMSSDTFLLTVTAVNDAPTLDAISNPAALAEDAAQQTMNLAGIGSGAANESQTLTITASSSNPALIPDPSVSYTSPNATGTLQFTPVPNAFGTATITVQVADDGGVDTTTRTFVVTVSPVADTPSLTDAATNEDTQTTSGLVISRNAADGAEVSHYQITAITGGTLYQADGTTAIGEGEFITAGAGAAGLKFTPAFNSATNGSFKVQASTSADAAGLGGDVVEATITVTAVNDAPTLDVVADISVAESAPSQNVALSGISAGPADESGQALSVTASSSNPALVPDPTVIYTSPDATGSLQITPVAGMSGSATITVVVTDNGSSTVPNVNSFTRTFVVFVGEVNNRPTLNTPANVSLLEDASPRTVNLSGIGSGSPAENQTLTVTATSSNPALIPNPTVTYSSPNAVGTLIFAPAANAFGTATITIKVQDNGGTSNGGIDTYTTTFTVTVVPVNDAPSFMVGPNQSVSAGAGPQTVAGWATGFVAGPANEAGQGVLGYEVVSVSNPTLFALTPRVSPAGVLTYTPQGGAGGTATVSVLVRDTGGTANGGVNASSVQTFTITIVPVKPTYWVALPMVVR